MVQKLTGRTEEVLAYFFQHPSAEVHIRGLSDSIDIPYSSVRNALKELEEQGFVDSREESKMTFYAAGQGGDPFRQRKQLYNLQALYGSQVVELLAETFRPDALVLFGSYLRGTDREDSDIDIAVVNGRDVTIDLGTQEAELGRTFQFVEIEDPRDEEPEFRNTLANGYVLTGHLEVV